MSSHLPVEAGITLSSDQDTLSCFGDWTLGGVVPIQSHLAELLKQVDDHLTLEMSGISQMDSAGALIISDFMGRLRERNKKVTLLGLSGKHESLLRLVLNELKKNTDRPQLASSIFDNPLAVIGRRTVEKIRRTTRFLSFIGEISIAFFRVVAKPRRFKWRLMIKSLDDTGYQALPIVALLTFLVGVVLTYQISLGLNNFGMDIYVVNIISLVVLREFGPLITAIIAAARTSTSMTAQVGAMKVNEELDALQTMSISPVERLVIPKFCGTIVAMLLLTVWADVFGVLGGMVMAKLQLGINYHTFITRFHEVAGVKQYLLGMIKVPVFAMIIATVGCFHGFQVLSTADSVGRRTTQSAVQSIFLVIVVDALFSVLFSWQGL